VREYYVWKKLIKSCVRFLHQKYYNTCEH
jgi:hypothetical protein